MDSCVDMAVLTRLCQLLSVSDIMLLIYTLETLLALTSSGSEVIISVLTKVEGAISTLVSLLTVEAQSYGPKGCILMRVVETVTGGVASGQQSGAPVSTGVATSIAPMSSVANLGTAMMVAGTANSSCGQQVTTAGSGSVSTPMRSQNSTLVSPVLYYNYDMISQ